MEFVLELLEHVLPFAVGKSTARSPLREESVYDIEQRNPVQDEGTRGYKTQSRSLKGDERMTAGRRDGRETTVRWAGWELLNSCVVYRPLAPLSAERREISLSEWSTGIGPFTAEPSSLNHFVTESTELLVVNAAPSPTIGETSRGASREVPFGSHGGLDAGKNPFEGANEVEFWSGWSFHRVSRMSALCQS